MIEKPTLKYKPRVLIVDDEKLIRKVLSKFLSDKNYIVHTAENGQYGLEELDKYEFDLVLTDLRMPEMDGREFLKIMSEKYPKIPKIVLTAYSTNEDIIIALKTGAYDFYTKPITDLTILEHSINRAIEKKLLSDEKNKYLEQLTQINRIISMLNSGKNTREILSSLNETLKKTIPFHKLTLAIILKTDDLISTKLVASDKESTLESSKPFPLDKQLLNKVYINKEVLNIPKLINYSKKNSQSKLVEILLQEHMNSSLLLPLIINNETRGFLIFASREINAFQDDHINFLESIGGQISLSIQRGELLYEIKQHTKNLELVVEQRTSQIIKTQKTTIFALSKLAETRDPETGDHLERIRSYCVLIAQILKYSNDHNEITSQYLRDLFDSSILHDIGKVGIPDDILLKDSDLSEPELEVMKTHTIIGYRALKSASVDLGLDSFLKMGMDITRYHHERWDGTGYPENLKGEEIPLSARIVAIADVYDALSSRRPYKDAYTHQKSTELIRNEAGFFDPEIFTIFLENESEFNKIRTQFENIRF